MWLRTESAWLVFAAAVLLSGVPRSSTTWDPNDPEKTRPTVSREERDKLGLTPKTWGEVVHPDVYEALDRLNKKIKSLKARVREGRDLQAMDVLQRVRFEETIYVQVRLKNKQAHSTVLGSLTASEFHPRQILSDGSGFVGYATTESLKKLAKNPHVAGVSIDDKPLPIEDRVIAKDDLPPQQSGDTSPDQPGVKEGIVEAEVYRALSLYDRVDVVVSLHRESLSSPTESPSEAWRTEERRQQEAKRLQDHVLSAVNADQFWVRVRHRGLPTISGRINREALTKLRDLPEVKRINLPRLYRPATNLRK
ncbi:MAG: hypothetical protein AMXMBFR13_25600 [Phycisphaerae bacterium]